MGLFADMKTLTRRIEQLEEKNMNDPLHTL